MTCGLILSGQDLFSNSCRQFDPLQPFDLNQTKRVTWHVLDRSDPFKGQTRSSNIKWLGGWGRTIVAGDHNWCRDHRIQQGLTTLYTSNENFSTWSMISLNMFSIYKIQIYRFAIKYRD